ncbi:MAG: hypothetical protein AAFR99_18110, partial [Cyanobacteria bacterium J06629_9]
GACCWAQYISGMRHSALQPGRRNAYPTETWTFPGAKRSATRSQTLRFFTVAKGYRLHLRR